MKNELSFFELDIIKKQKISFSRNLALGKEAASFWGLPESAKCKPQKI
jgi:hypothetical protein